ncbi:MAG: hypothetical protein JNJ77_06370 [Planctomycetia bacterium]|nr:hypothetical protein [Planctomycetia bacterium]
MDGSLFQITVNSDYRSYDQFIDYSWNEKLGAEIQTEPLKRIVGRLILHWKSANLTHHMQQLMIKCIASMAKGFVSAKSSIQQALELIESHLEHYEFLALSESQRSLLSQWIQSKSHSIEGVTRELINEVDESKLFSHFFCDTDFQIAIWSGQRQAYSSLYFGYEYFVLSMFLHVSGRTNYRMTNSSLNADLRSTFSDNIATKCWINSRRSCAGFIRHALAHAGGTETDELKKIRHGISVLDGMLQVMPENNRNLYELLKSMADTLISHCIPVFSKEMK